jgi:PhnB protein
MTNNDPTIQTMLFLDGRCDEALDFYKTALGAEVIMLMRNKDNPEPAAEGCPNMPADKVMHAQFRIGNTVVMACDGRCGGKPVFEGFGLTLNVPTEVDADTSFAALSEGGAVMMPLAKTFFSPRFGMVTDQFGVWWMIRTTPRG